MTDNRTTELLPCPLCGGEMSVALHGDEFGWYWWTVQRGHDDATACRCRMFVESDMKFTLEDHEKPEDYTYAMELKERLVRKWNTRHVETCHAESDLSEWVCSRCQCWIPLGLTPENIKNASEWRYCPHCGAKVVG